MTQEEQNAFTSDITKELVVTKCLIKFLQWMTISIQARESNRKLHDKTENWSSFPLLQKSKVIPKLHLMHWLAV